MPKRKRNSTWYREYHKENEEILKKIFTTEDQEFESEETSHTSLCSKSSAYSSSINNSISKECDNILGSSESGGSTDSREDLESSGLDDYFQEQEHTQKLGNWNITKTYSCSDKLRDWAVTNKITHTALKQLLNILRHLGSENFSQLPKDPRTFLTTPKYTVVRKVEPGAYYHIGIQNSLETLYCNLNKFPEEQVNIAVNIDGLPISKSSHSQFYPIVGIDIQSKNVFMIGLYHGYNKPDNFNNFLSEFVEEATTLTTNGITLNGKHYTFKILMYLFDAVAKASVLYIRGHAGYSSCTKCDQEGDYIKDRVCFPDLKFTLRTHDTFIAQNDPDHHTGESILINIPNIDIISDVPLDYMHLVLLGVVKKLLCGIWCCGKPPNKFSNYQLISVSRLLIDFVPYIPSEFARCPRDLKEVKRWKATEFRQFLLYTGPICLKSVLSKKKYQHFILLSVSIRILSSKKMCPTHVDYAETLLSNFVLFTKEIYGSHLLTHNFHNLLHLADDVRKFGCLDNFSNFASENFLYTLGKLLRKNEKPLQQIINRYHEINTNRIFPKQLKNSSDFELIKPHSGGILIEGCSAPEYKTVAFKGFKLSCCLKDSCCVLKNKSIVEIKNIAYCKEANTFVLIGQKYENPTNFFEFPCLSSLVDVYFVSKLGVLEYWPLTNVDYKSVRLPYDSGFVVYPMIHATC